jgi:hypothetical protein
VRLLVVSAGITIGHDALRVKDELQTTEADHRSPANPRSIFPAFA